MLKLNGVSLLVRITGGITHILWEQNPKNTSLQTIFSIMESAGLSPLLMATLAFLSIVYVPPHLLSARPHLTMHPPAGNTRSRTTRS